MREIKVIKHLTDVEVDEDSDAVFTSEINYADEEAQWLLNDKVLFTNDVNTITHEGKSHKLTLKNLAPQDGGTITFKVRKVKESVILKVKGKIFVLGLLKKIALYIYHIKAGNHWWVLCKI